ncbi:hypothetical protein TSTA_121430 [Talaromyces stipitatus ATCC 10500]|nr:uncharacterized protein TSTA_121430 [Talaromyces stipitatus ATCC 10500]XP_002486737.1 uncharacterized protein TSTA_107070 [Talaromyces stipitatus ATCC 10500]EED14499.1 hypothetical protein TSTA_107070 [Talaromyces stipitatus ATCC 10500]EED18400.1 hypothetical protein TSTA_121430 [Talaromyces stipitatus ATCC 10500]
MALAILLARLSYPRRVRDLEIFFGRSFGYISTIFNDVLQHLYRRYKRLLEWHPLLTQERCKAYAQILEAQGAIPRGWGCIDGTFRATCRPSKNQRIAYSGYKKRHGFKYQGIITPDGMVLSLIGPFEATFIWRYWISGMSFCPNTISEDWGIICTSNRDKR